MPSPLVYTSTVGFARKNKGWFLILFGIVLSIPALFFIFFNILIPPDDNDSTPVTYFSVAEAARFDWYILRAYDTVRYDGDLSKADPRKTIFDIMRVSYKEYDIDYYFDESTGKWIRDKDLIRRGTCYSYYSIRQLLKSFGYTGSMSIDKVLRFFDRLDRSDEYVIEYQFLGANILASRLPDSQREWFFFLVDSLPYIDPYGYYESITINPSELKYRIPRFFQNDKRWGYIPYTVIGSAKQTIGSSGCGPTAASMIVTGLTGNIVTPVDACRFSLQHGYRTANNGTSPDFFFAFAKKYGISVNDYPPSKWRVVVSNLEKGNPVISNVGPGHFTSEGHYIVLTGVSSKGLVIINDPASPSRSEKLWDFGLILDETKRFYVFSKS